MLSNPLLTTTAICSTICVAIVLLSTRTLPDLDTFTFSPNSSDFAEQACPSPFTPRYNAFDRSLTFPDIRGDDGQCQRPEIQAGLPFEVAVCSNTKRCNALSLYVKPINCVRSPGRELSEDRALDHELKTRGEFEFRLSIQGAEVWSTGDYRFDQQDCVYRFDVALQNSGWAAMKLAIFFQNWTAFDEMVHEAPPNLNQQLFVEPYILAPCTGCPRYYAPAVIPGDALIASVDPESKLTLTTEATFGNGDPSKLSSIPSCDVAIIRDPIEGAFLPFPPALSSANFFPHRPNGFAGTHAFVPQSCMYRHGGMRFADHTNCLTERGSVEQAADRERTYLVIGDSHSRVFYDGMLHRLQGNKDYIVSSQKAGHRHLQIGPLYLNFTWDPRLETIPTCEDLEKLDGVVIGVGHHPASNLAVAQWGEILDALDKIASCPILPPLVFLTPPPQPPRTDPWPKKTHDRRTCSRTKYFGQMAQQRALATKAFSVVNQYSLLEPFVYHPLQLDEAHWLETDGLEAVIDETMGKLGICGLNEIYLPEPSIEALLPA